MGEVAFDNVLEAALAVHAELQRLGNRLLWIIPVLMLSIIILGFTRRILERMPALPALIITVGGGIAAYLMYREESSTKTYWSPIIAHWTGEFWCGLLASIALGISGVWLYWKRIASP